MTTMITVRGHTYEWGRNPRDMDWELHLGPSRALSTMQAYITQDVGELVVLISQGPNKQFAKLAAMPLDTPTHVMQAMVENALRLGVCITRGHTEETS